ncbi:hypothetical protein [Streptomyces sp. Midd1]|uniref:hypothetical protein n=1 Tax=Streptomyces sp. Midd3 TaxID=3161191 RepID=UPI0034DAF329
MVDVRALVADAERLAAPFVARPVDMRRCPVHGKEYAANWAGLLVCPDPAHQPRRGEEEE